jgi:hypothetical protein
MIARVDLEGDRSTNGYRDAVPRPLCHGSAWTPHRMPLKHRLLAQHYPKIIHPLGGLLFNGRNRGRTRQHP